MKRHHIFRPSVFVILMLLLCVVFGERAMAQSLSLEGRSASWKPIAGDRLLIFAKIDDPNNTLSSRSVKFELSNVSSWQGTCMNSDIGDNDEELASGTKPDLKFLKARNQFKPVSVVGASDAKHEASWTEGKTGDVSWVKAECQTGAPTSYTLAIHVLDYAAYGELTARLLDGSGTEVAGAAISLPLDANGNYIADSWENDATNDYNPAVDDETGPAGNAGVENNTNLGDGLVVFEEYRGFKVNGNHTRTRPSKKDLFIYTEFGVENGATTDYGIGWATNLPGIFVTHRIIIEEMKDEDIESRIINFNSLGTPVQFGAVDKWRVINQCALHVQSEPGTNPEGARILGVTTRTLSPRGGPASVDVIKIYTEGIDNISKKTIRFTPLTSTADLYRQVIGHEIGHGMNLQHPWEGSIVWKGIQNTTYTDPIKAIDKDPNIWDRTVTPHVILVNTYTPSLSTTANAANYTYTYGSSIMDYQSIPEGRDANGNPRYQGIFPSSSYHRLHNWEYDLVYPRGDRQTTATHNRRSRVVDATWSGVLAMLPYACGEHSGASSEASQHAERTGACGHTYYSCQQTEHQLLSCPTDQGRTCEHQTYYACSPHTHAYSGEALRPCGHPMTASGDHRVTRFSSCGHYGYVCDTSHQSTRCPPGPNGETCSVSGGLYLPCSAASHTHTYPKGSTPKPTTQHPPDTQPTTRPCGHSITASGDHSVQKRCSRDSRCIATDFYYCRHSSHTYSDPPPVVCPADSRTNCGGTVSHAARCGQGHTYYTCSTSDVLQHSGHTQNDDSNDDSEDTDTCLTPARTRVAQRQKEINRC